MNETEIAILGCAAAEVGNTDGDRYLRVFNPGAHGLAWCGNLALYVYQRAGVLLDWTWVLGKGIRHKSGKTLRPLHPGAARSADLMYMHRNQHYAILANVTVEAGQYFTHCIEGNISGRVVTKRRTLNEWDAAFDIHEHFPIYSGLSVSEVPASCPPTPAERDPEALVLPRFAGVSPGDVKALQRELVTRQMYDGRVDAIVGPQTMAGLFELAGLEGRR